MKRASGSLIVVLLAGLLLGACSGTPTELPMQSPVPVPTEQTGGLTVVDALGRSIQFPELPRRIVVAGNSTLTVVDTLYMFPEAKERLVALVVGRQPVGDFIRLVDPGFGDKMILEVEAGPEQIVPLDPDVVLLRSFAAEKLGTPLEQLDIPVIYVDLETPEQYFRDLTTLGQLLGNEARAAEIQSFYQSQLARITEPLQGLKDEQKPRVLVVQYSDQGGEVALNVPSTSWIQTTEVELAGGIPAWKEAVQGGGWTVVGFEQIAAWDPDQIFLISYKSDPSRIVDDLKTDPRWQALRAVQDGRIYGFAADIFSWDQPDPRWILGVTWLAGKVHADRFPSLDLMQEVSQFFGQMYGMDEGSIREHILPNLKGDVE